MGMKERPIIFQAPMVRAIIDGQKTQTRRPLYIRRNRKRSISASTSVLHHRLPPPATVLLPGEYWGLSEWLTLSPATTLWVRETWGYVDPDGTGIDYASPRMRNDEGTSGPCRSFSPEMLEPGNPLREFWRRRIAYAATWKDGPYGTGLEKPSRWFPSIHIPRWAARLELEVVSRREELLQDISRGDALAEGIVQLPDGGYGLPAGEHYHHTDPRESYWSLWEAINGPGSVEANPPVVVIDFKKKEQTA